MRTALCVSVWLQKEKLFKLRLSLWTALWSTALRSSQLGALREFQIRTLPKGTLMGPDGRAMRVPHGTLAS